MTSDRDGRRLERYTLLREYGFTAIEAGKLRDASSEEIDRAINDKVKRLERRKRLSETESKALNRIRDRGLNEDRRIFTRTERLDLYRQWSNRFIGFPDEALERIRRYNASANENPNASFGFRQFYHEFVNGMNEDEALMLAREGSP